MNAITLPFVNKTFFFNKKPSKELIEHENIHLEQIKKEGSLKFAISYAAQFLLKGYENISYEIEANKNTKTIGQEQIKEMRLLRYVIIGVIGYKVIKRFNK